MSAWGRTGRVTRDSRDILVDGVPVGYACAGYAEVYAERLGKPWTTTAAPSRDAAVLWVLRRVDPALWREERGDVGTMQVADDAWVLQAPGHPSYVLRRWSQDDPDGWTFDEALSALVDETKGALR